MLDDLDLLANSKTRFLYFFEAVFDATAREVDGLPEIEPSKFAMQWRETLRTGSSEFRTKLYRKAVEAGETKVRGQ
jgi:hypothetical protein